ncbi:phage tail protein [Halocynthiibacter styelae]|uniref:Phage tail protein n=1 Tax=Halocynthiibacter styelae TaxID=2761955 RepID=A0A8J7IYZ2_9RHOB|nr:tail fiber protein [Paenihalocynthiibacter styelae]MBI1494839.1 phage tail protein [Paenihalocynthiibacter styelae]
MEPFIAQIMIFGGTFAPRGWAFCDGQLLPISSNEALFSLIGTTYGGDGRTNFALPDLRGRAPIHEGQGPGLTNRQLGHPYGAEQVSLTANQLPEHSHTMNVANAPADNSRPQGDMLGRSEIYTATTSPTVPLAAETISGGGSGHGHDNIQPSLAVNYIIALQGIYPSRS